ncbi:AMM_1a_G0000090.mRNA.1.CDS.1 [Saccharomyces cerevisiae]|nr:AMM_1a_G0000090.mRNA.1.CDS.1 [Saccharomyces cerevisiae]CAI6466118.1 AMM_1a_G0000090.mRNA.1.CDS.1 [Saccharomyces cerevisiae]
MDQLVLNLKDYTAKVTFYTFSLLLSSLLCITMASTDSSFILFHYTPSKPAATLFAVLFILATIIYALQIVYDAKKASRKSKANPFVPLDDKSAEDVYNHRKMYKVSSTVCVFIPFL